MSNAQTRYRDAIYRVLDDVSELDESSQERPEYDAEVVAAIDAIDRASMLEGKQGVAVLARCAAHCIRAIQIAK